MQTRPPTSSPWRAWPPRGTVRGPSPCNTVAHCSSLCPPSLTAKARVHQNYLKQLRPVASPHLALESRRLPATLWEGFGTKYAYISTGLFDHAFNGTTLAIGKKGSGLAAVVNPCIDKFAATKAYYDLCVKYDMVGSCLPNSYFPADTSAPKPYMKATKDQATTSCSDGYCGCNAGGSLTKA